MSTAIDSALHALRAGQVIAYPTEAVYGLGCRADDETAVRRIAALKGRAIDKGMIVLVDSLDLLGDWIEAPDAEQRQRLESTWPGPVTWLIPATQHCPGWLKGNHSSLAVRHSDHPVCARLVSGLGRPLVSTSANRAGRPAARTADRVRSEFAEGIDYVFDGPVGARDAASEIRDLVTGRRLR